MASARPIVLIIDEHEDSRVILRSILEYAGFDVAECEDPRAGLELARQVSPVAMIVDLDMRQLTGFEMLMLLRLDPALELCPVIASASHERADQALAGGFQAFIPKPFRIAELILQLRRLTGEIEPATPEQGRAGRDSPDPILSA